MEEKPELDEDAEMTTPITPTFPNIILAGQSDPEEAALEAREINKYLLAKSFFDCREFDRCAAVFLPETILSSVIRASENMHQQPAAGPQDKGKTQMPSPQTPKLKPHAKLPKLSQKSLFLALYAKLMAGEKRKDEDIEMVMGPHDSGKTVNKELVKIHKILHHWFQERDSVSASSRDGSQGWLEYLYGVVLAKERNEKDAMEYLIRSVQAFPMNWGAWLEIANLVNSYTEVCFNLLLLILRPLLNAQPAQHSLPPSPTQRLLLHLPPSHLPRPLSIVTHAALPSSGPSSRFPNQRLPPYMFRPALLPLQRLPQRRAPILRPPLQASSSSRQPGPLQQHLIRHGFTAEIIFLGAFV